MLDPAHMGRIPQMETKRDRSKAGLRWTRDDGDTGRTGPALDSLHEVRLATALHLFAERAGVHRTANRGVFSPRDPQSTSEWEGSAGGFVDRLRTRFRAPTPRAWEGVTDQWFGVVLVR